MPVDTMKIVRVVICKPWYLLQKCFIKMFNLFVDNAGQRKSSESLIRDPTHDHF